MTQYYLLMLIRAIFLSAVFIILFLVGNFAVSISTANYPYDQPVIYLQLIADMLDLKFNELKIVDNLALNACMLISFTAILSASFLQHKRQSRYVQLVAFYSLPLGIMGLLSITWQLCIWQPHDGEWLAEGWPLIDLAALWCIAMLTYAQSIKKRTKATN